MDPRRQIGEARQLHVATVFHLGVGHLVGPRDGVGDKGGPASGFEALPAQTHRVTEAPHTVGMAESDNPFRWFDSSPELIQMVVMPCVRFPLSRRNVEDLAFERGVDICHETVRKWVNRFGPMFASKIRSKRVAAMRQHTHWKWHLDEIFVRVNGERRDLWRAVDHEGEVLDRL
jgi:hypothetical protein